MIFCLEDFLSGESLRSLQKELRKELKFGEFRSKNSGDLRLICFFPNSYDSIHRSSFPLEIYQQEEKTELDYISARTRFIWGATCSFVDVGAFHLFCNVLKEASQHYPLETPQELYKRELLLTLELYFHLFGNLEDLTFPNRNRILEQFLDNLDYSICEWNIESSQNLEQNKERDEVLIFLHVVSQSDHRIHADLNWTHKLMELVAKKAYLHQENLFCQILGAAYAAMTRDSDNRINAEKARQFAERQLIIANKLEDGSLRLKAGIYIGYYFMWTKQFQKSEQILKKHLKISQISREEEVEKMAMAALVRLQQEVEHIRNES